MRSDPAQPRNGPHIRVESLSRPRTDLSVVVPIYDEAAVLPTLVERLTRVLDGLNITAEVILVDDGSADATLEGIARAHEADRRFVGLSLSRNFGHQVAISAGLAESRGQAVLIMDGDLQDPPEAIPALWAKHLEGYDVVYAIRASRPEAWPKRAAYRAFYRLLDRLVTVPIPLDAGDFGIVSRRVADLIAAMPERRRYVRGLRAWVGFRQVGLPIDRDARHAGRPKYTLRKLANLAIDGLVGLGEGPLRPVGVLGGLAVLLAALCATGGLARGTIGWGWPPGWGWVGLAVLFFGGAQLISAAIVGEYVGRILQEVNGRPLYVARRRIGLDPPGRPRGRDKSRLDRPRRPVTRPVGPADDPLRHAQSLPR